MALFNHLFPYSNLHDINLDWIISIIKSIDPAVIQALQELTPDIIEQVNQKVSEAQAAAIAAQSSASEANTARENAATSASEAAQDAAEAATNATEAGADAVRAENAANEAGSKAETAVANALSVSIYGVVQSGYATIGDAQVYKSGKTFTLFLACTMTGKNASGTTTDVGTVEYFPGTSGNRRFTGNFWRSGSPHAIGTVVISTNGVISVNNANFETGDVLYIDTAFMA